MTCRDDVATGIETETRRGPNRRALLKAVGASALLGNIGIIGTAGASSDPAEDCQNDDTKIEWTCDGSSWTEQASPTGAAPGVFTVRGDCRNATFCNNSDTVGETSYTVSVRSKGGQCRSEYLEVGPGECIEFTATSGSAGDDPAPYIACDNTNTNPDFSNIKGCVTGTTEKPKCDECVSGTQLVKYEWDNDAGTLVVEGPSDPNIKIGEIVLDEDGEPKKICLTHSYCAIKIEVKGGQGTATETDSSGSVCITEVEWEKHGKSKTAAISNFVVYCA
jgi:hypothetical protein